MPNSPTKMPLLILSSSNLCRRLVLLLFLYWGFASPIEAKVAEAEQSKQAIGATAIIKEVSSGALFSARVDTGAESCSLHVNQIEVIGGRSNMRENWRKPIRFSVTCSETKKEHWIDSKIQSTVIVKTSEKEERRYKAWVTFEYEGTKKKILVTLNDRSKMDFPLLIGRNFLKGDFVVDVAKDATD